MSINKVMITGNLTRDPELRSTGGGTPVLELGVAVNDRRRNQSGEWEDVPNFFDAIIFGARAEALSRYLSKGSKVAIEGKLRWRSWENQQGEKRSKVEIIVDEVEFMSSRDGGSGGGKSYGDSSAGKTYGGSSGSSAPVADDEEIPF